MVSNPLKSGDELPTHMPTSNVLLVKRYGVVRDAETGRRLKEIVDESFFKTVKQNHDTLRRESPEMHWFKFEAGKVYHTRDAVVIELE